MHRTTMGLVYLLTVVGCASMGGYKPTGAPYNDRHASRIPQDEQECRQLAQEASGGTAKEAAVGGAVGGLLGAATGAAVGAAVGRPGTGAAVGAAAGGGSEGRRGGEEGRSRGAAGDLKKKKKKEASVKRWREDDRMGVGRWTN